MSDPSRFVDDEGTSDFERGLLRSARLDREPEDGAARALAALGIGAVEGVTDAGAGASKEAPSSTGAADPPSVTGAASASGLAVGKLAGLAVLVGASALGVIALLRASPAPAQAPRADVPEQVRPRELAPAPPAPLERVLAEAPAPPVERGEVGSTSSPPRAVLRAPSSASAAARPESKARTPAPLDPPDRSSLSEETALIDRVRASMRAGDPSAAERALDEHAARFPRGSLTAEATVARIELSLTRGDFAGARARGERFLREHPGSPHERRVNALLGRANEPASIP